MAAEAQVTPSNDTQLEFGKSFSAVESIDCEPVHLFGSRRSDAMEFLDGKLRYEGGAVLRRNDELAIRLVLVRRHFGQELVVGNSR